PHKPETLCHLIFQLETESIREPFLTILTVPKPQQYRYPDSSCSKVRKTLFGGGKMIEVLAYISAAILLPFIPAYVLYKTLPSRTTVKGPFKGLNIKLGGAFGGYFLLVITIFGFIFTHPSPPPSWCDIYRVEGKLDVASNDVQNTTLKILSEDPVKA